MYASPICVQSLLDDFTEIPLPCGPVGPLLPVGPTGPGITDAAPTAPVGPTGPSTPGLPVGPIGPGIFAILRISVNSFFNESYV